MAGAEKFDYAAVKSSMDSLNTIFEEFAKNLRDINNEINDNVNVGPDSALFGEYGARLLDTWNQNASTFGDFYENFNSWSEMVTTIAANNESFEYDALRTIGSNADGVLASRKAKAQDMGTKLQEKYISRDVKSADGKKTTRYNMDEAGKVKSYEEAGEDGSYKKVFLNEKGEEVMVCNREDEDKYSCLFSDGKDGEYMKSLYEEYGNTVIGLPALPEEQEPSSVKEAMDNLSNNLKGNYNNSLKMFGLGSGVIAVTSLSKGDVVTIDDSNYKYYGTTKDGVNLYTDNDGVIRAYKDKKMVDYGKDVLGEKTYNTYEEENVKKLKKLVSAEKITYEDGKKVDGITKVVYEAPTDEKKEVTTYVNNSGSDSKVEAVPASKGISSVKEKKTIVFDTVDPRKSGNYSDSEVDNYYKSKLFLEGSSSGDKYAEYVNKDGKMYFVYDNESKKYYPSSDGKSYVTKDGLSSEELGLRLM